MDVQSNPRPRGSFGIPEHLKKQIEESQRAAPKPPTPESTDRPAQETSAAPVAPQGEVVKAQVEQAKEAVDRLVGRHPTEPVTAE